MYLHICLSIYLSIHLSICLSIHPSVYLKNRASVKRFVPIFTSVSQYLTIGRTPWTGDEPSHCRYLHTVQRKHRINAHSHPRLAWDSDPRSHISVWAVKTFHALDHAATVIGGFPPAAFTIKLICCSKVSLATKATYITLNFASKTEPVSETSCFYSQEYRTTQIVQNPSNSVCYTPSSEPFKIYQWISCIAVRHVHPSNA
jgi:hypothetical protein